MSGVSLPCCKSVLGVTKGGDKATPLQPVQTWGQAVIYCVRAAAVLGASRSLLGLGGGL